MNRELNIDVAGAVSDLEDAVNALQLKLKFYRTLFRGKGLDFDGYRTFTQDDDALYIDWRASRRANKLLTKQYIEEKDKKMMFVIDMGNGMVTGSTEKLKCEYAAEVAVALSHLILSSGDMIGFIIFNNEVMDYITPKKGKKQFEFFVDTLSNASNYHSASNLNKALDFLVTYVPTSVKAVFIISDFLTTKKNSLDLMKMVGDKFETVAIMVKDPVDVVMPDESAEVVIEDPATGQRLLMNPKLAKNYYDMYTKKQEENLRWMFKESGIDLLSLSTKDSFVFALAEFLKERIRKRAFV